MSEVKIVVVGAGGVGKSALTVRFVRGNFLERYDPTIEDSYRKQVDIDGKAYVLDILDTAGQEEYSGLRDQYMKTGHGFVLVYSLVSAPSMEDLYDIRDHIVRTKEDPNIPMVVVGNKVDLEDEREVKTSVGEELAASWNAKFLEASAMTQQNVEEIFHTLVRLVNSKDGPVKKKKKGCALL